MKAGLLALLIAFWNGCSPDANLTQIVVRVDADDEVVGRLESLRVDIYDPESEDGQGRPRLVENRPFAVNAGKQASGAVTFPFSLGVLKRNADRFLLVVTGFSKDARGALVPVIEQKALVGFVSGQTRLLGVYLAAPCIEQCLGESGEDLSHTCFVVENDVTECTSVSEAATVRVKPRSEFDTESTPETRPRASDAGTTDGDDADSGDDAGMDAALKMEAGQSENQGSAEASMGATAEGGITDGIEPDAAHTCIAKSCRDQGFECGPADDGCGVPLDCGKCTAQDELCGGGGQPNRCGCPRNPDPCGGKECGTASDGCGGTVQCGALQGACAPARMCSAEQTCACRTSETVCAGKCGTQAADGCQFNCGACVTTCASGGPCAICQCPAGPAPGTADDQICLSGTCCTPEPATQTCGSAQCGAKINNCGQTVNCGSGCSGSAVCTDHVCIDPKKAALLGTYAVRYESFAAVSGNLTRSETFSYVTIALSTDPGSVGELRFTEMACGARQYLSTATSPTTETLPSLASRYEVQTSPLLVPGQAAGLPGPLDWLHEPLPGNQNGLGFRRGRPSYCPLATSAAPTPGPDPSHFAYAPPSDSRALGAKKPWLSGSDCLCPEQETAKRSLCTAGSADERSACVANWAQNALPSSAGGVKADSDVTDCRVVDDDGDGKPGVTSTGNVLGLTATTRVAAVLATRAWGAVDVAQRRHSGVYLEQAESTTSIMACSGASVLCTSSVSAYCAPFVNAARSNRVDFVPFDATSGAPSTPVDGPCFRIWDQRTALFSHLPKATTPPTAACKAYPGGPPMGYP